MSWTSADTPRAIQIIPKSIFFISRKKGFRLMVFPFPRRLMSVSYIPSHICKRKKRENKRDRPSSWRNRFNRIICVRWNKCGIALVSSFSVGRYVLRPKMCVFVHVVYTIYSIALTLLPSIWAGQANVTDLFDCSSISHQFKEVWARQMGTLMLYTWRSGSLRYEHTTIVCKYMNILEWS